MRKLLLSIALLLFTSAAYGQTNVGGGGGGAASPNTPADKTVATLPGSPATGDKYVVTDGNGLSCTVAGGSTRVLCRWNGASWDVVNFLTGKTGQVDTAVNGASDSFQSVGIPGTDVNAATYTVQCDSATAQIDRATTIRFITTAPTVTMPDPTASGCGANFPVTLVASGVTVTVNRTTTAVFNIYNGSSVSSAQTTFNLTTGQYATLTSPDNANWLVRVVSGAASLPASAKVLGTNGSSAGIAALQTDVNSIGYAAGGGTAQAQTVTLAPAITALGDGLNVFWKPTAANTAPGPTLAVNGLTATTITKLGGTPLAANDLKTTAIAWAIYNSSGPRFELQNPQGVGSVVNVTAVTATNPSAEAALMELALPTGFLNSLNQPYAFHGSGIYTIAAAQTPTLRYRVKLCTVSGCGSGTVVTLADIITSASLTLTNNNWNLNVLGVTNATGATGTLITHGNPGLAIDLAAGTTGADTVFGDVNTASSGTIDLTAALFVDFTILLSSSNAGNTVTQQIGAVMPQSNPAGSGGGGGVVVQVNGSSTGITTTANLNDTTPAAPSGSTQNVLWQKSGSSISAYVPNVIPNPALGRYFATHYSAHSFNSLSEGSGERGSVCGTSNNIVATASEPPYVGCVTGTTLNTTQSLSVSIPGNADYFIGTAGNPTNLHAVGDNKISTTTAIRHWGIVISDQTAATLGTSDSPAGNSAGIRFSSVAGDTNFMLVLCNAGTCSTTSTGVTGDTAHHIFQVKLNDVTGTATGCVDAACVTQTTNYPASVGVGISIITDNTTTTSVTGSYSQLYVRSAK